MAEVPCSSLKTYTLFISQSVFGKPQSAMLRFIMSSNSWKYKILLLKCNEQAHTNGTKILFWFLFWLQLDFTFDDWLALYRKLHTIYNIYIYIYIYTHTHSIRCQSCKFFLTLSWLQQTTFSIEHTSEEIYLENLPIWQELMDLRWKTKVVFSCTNN